MMFSIQYSLDDSIEFEGKTYQINASFDNILKVLDVLEERLPEIVLVDVCLKLLIGDYLDELEHKEILLVKILDKYLKTKPKTMIDIAGNELPLPEEEADEVLDFKEDAGLIYAAFYQTYKIDLIEEQGKLHWLKFKALLNGLPEGTALSKVIEIRQWTPDKKNYKAQMQMLKDKYRLR